jgi:hypothetical protein
VGTIVGKMMASHPESSILRRVRHSRAVVFRSWDSYYNGILPLAGNRFPKRYRRAVRVLTLQNEYMLCFNLDILLDLSAIIACDASLLLECRCSSSRSPSTRLKEQTVDDGRAITVLPRLDIRHVS